MSDMPTALVLGGYGLIGSACCRALAHEGFRVIGLGRSHRSATASGLDQEWVIRDLAALTSEDWRALLDGVDVVVNAAGALQDGPRDNLDAIHSEMPRRLCEAMGSDARLVQVSAAGVSPHASTEFFRSKARGDDHVTKSKCAWVILRPTLVLSPDAYGGTALLRGAAGLPAILPRVMPRSRIQVVHVEDLAACVAAAAKGRLASGTTLDVTGPGEHSLPELIAAIRRWQGFAAPKIEIPVPAFALRLAGRMADVAGHLGWRSPMRSTALEALRDGIEGDSDATRAAGLPAPRGLSAALSALPSTRQERMFARLYFVIPLSILILSAFWMISGIMALAQPGNAANTLSSSALPSVAVWGVVLGGAMADILLGAAILWRRWCRPAALAMAVLAAGYLLGGLAYAPSLWIDPLGPMIKVLPSIALAIVVWLGVED